MSGNYKGKVDKLNVAVFEIANSRQAPALRVRYKFKEILCNL